MNHAHRYPIAITLAGFLLTIGASNAAERSAEPSEENAPRHLQIAQAEDEGFFDELFDFFGDDEAESEVMQDEMDRQLEDDLNREMDQLEAEMEQELDREMNQLEAEMEQELNQMEAQQPVGTATNDVSPSSSQTTQSSQPAQPVAADAAATSPAATPGNAFQKSVLDLHNKLRADHCVPALTWSAQLAATAQEWANRCVFEHRQGGNLGENLAMGTSGAYTAASHVQSWYDEIKDYDFASHRSRTGQAVGHFTQVVWRGSTQLGCGMATCNGQDMLVCNYAEAGNMGGAYPQNVPQKCR